MCAAYYYSGGSPFGTPTVVLDVGSYSTKMGWAGDDTPRCYFRSNVAVRRHANNTQDTSNNKNVENDSMDIDAAETNTSSSSTSTGSYGRIRRNDESIRYDYYNRPIHYSTDDDGDYEPCTAVDIKGTGLLYQSINSNVIADYGIRKQQQQHHHQQQEQSVVGGVGGSTFGSSVDENEWNDTTIPDWYDLLQEYVYHGYRTGLVGCASNEHPILFIERSYNIPPIRQKIVECLFEECNVPATFIAKDAVLQCYGVGKTTAVSVDFGYSGTTVTPVYDGYAESKGIQRSPIGVYALDQLILEQMDRIYNSTNNNNNTNSTKSSRLQQQQQKQQNSPSGIMPLYQVRRKDHIQRKESIHTNCRLYLAQQCRESGAGVSINTTNSSSSNNNNASATGIGGLNSTSNSNSATNNNPASSGAAATVPKPAFHAPSKPFELPDGTILDIPSTDRFRAAEYYLLGTGGTGIGSMPLYPGSPVTIQMRRIQIYEQTKQQILSYCSATAATVVASMNYHQNQNNTNVNNNNNNTNSKSLNNEEENEQDAFSSQQAASAVGIISRKEKEDFQSLQKQKKSGKYSGSNSSNAISDQRQKQYIDSYIHWHRACARDLQTLANDQLTSNGIATMICDAAYNCDRDQQAGLLGNVVIGGGGATSIGPTDQTLPDTIREYVESLIHTHTPGWRVKVYTPPSNTERAILPWLGGSILGSLNTFQNMYITRAEYDEWGPAIVNRKCP